MQDNPSNWTIDDAVNAYQINRWSEGYFSVNTAGELTVLPTKNTNGPVISIPEIIDEMKKEGIQFPCVIRFHDILRNQVVIINETFKKIIKEAHFHGDYYGVFPIKVNQLREVIEEIVDII